MVFLNVQTSSEELFNSFRHLLPSKPYFDSSITLFTNETATKSSTYNAKDLHNWSTLDIGWTFSPMSVMSVRGHMTGIYPDLMKIIANKLELALRFHFTSSFDETNVVSSTHFN